MTPFYFLNYRITILLSILLMQYIMSSFAKASHFSHPASGLHFGQITHPIYIANQSQKNHYLYGNRADYIYSLEKKLFSNTLINKDKLKSVLFPHANAQEAITIQANYLPNFKYHLLSTATHISENEIFSRTDNLSGLLQFVPSAQIKQAGGMSGLANISLRGSHSNQTLFLLDDIRIESSSTGTAALAQLNAQVFENVQIINGNLSALYGANAIGGVIHLLSKEEGEYPPKIKAALNWGSYGRQNQVASIAGNIANHSNTFFSINIAHTKENGFSAQNPERPPLDSNPNPDDNGFNHITLNGFLAHQFRNGWKLSSRYFYSKSHSSYDFFSKQGKGELQGELVMNSLFLQGLIKDNWYSKLFVAKFRDKLKDTVDQEFKSIFDTNDYQFGWKNEYSLFPNNDLIFGLEHRRQHLKTNAIDFSPKRQITSFYIGFNGENQLNNLTHQTQINLRRDRYSHSDNVNSYYLGYGLKLSQHWRAIINFSTGYRIPTFNDLYSESVGNQQLQVEHAKSFETALEHQSSHIGWLKILFFKTHFQNLISYVFPKNINIDQADVKGIELIWKKKIAQAQISTSTTWQQPYDEKTKQQLPGRSRCFGSLVIDYPYKKWKFKAEVLAWSSRAGSSYSPATSGHMLTNFLTSFKINKEWSADIRLNNIFNIDYETIYGYNMPKRSVFFTLAWKQT